MRKVELIYLHALLAKLHEHLAARDDLPESFGGDGADEVGPYQIQRPKAEHEAAVRLLAAELAAAVSESRREPEVREA